MYQAVLTVLEETDAQLSEKQKLASTRDTLQLFLNMDMAVRKLELLLKEDTVSGGAADQTDRTGGSGAGVNVLERVAVEFFQLHFYVKQARDRPFVRALAPRIAAIEASLSSTLSGRFAHALATRDATLLGYCLRAYQAVDRPEEPERIYGGKVIRPWLHKHWTAAAIEAGVHGSTAGFPPLLEALARFLGERAADGGDLLGLPARQLYGVRVLSHAVFPEIKAALDATPQVFSPSDPAGFHRNYRACVAFLVGLEARHCPAAAQVAALRSHPAHAAVLAKWSLNLPVYFGLRFQDVALPLEARLVADADSPALETPRVNRHYRTLAAAAVDHALHQCWHHDVFLEPLAGRFLRCSLQALGRYAAHLGRALAVGSAPQLSRWSRGDLDALVAAHLDLRELSRQLLHDWPATMSARAGPGLPVKAAQKVLAPRAADLDRFDGCLAAVIVHRLVERPLEALTALKSLTATFRLLNKEVPTKPSLYVGNMVRSVQKQIYFFHN